ncbi:MAG: hypothetical protein IPO90_13225 [Flavobacteriales bacterium]|nr:hypothetical protein [Flavobacteriales bacterium]
MEIDLSAHGANKTLSQLKSVILQMRAENQELDSLLSSFTLRSSATPEAIARVKKGHAEVMHKLMIQDSLEFFKINMSVYVQTNSSEKDWFKLRTAARKEVSDKWIVRKQRRWTQPIGDFGMGEPDGDLEMLSIAAEDFVKRMRDFQGAREKLVQNLAEVMRLVSNAAQISSKTEHGTDLIWSNAIPKGKTEIVTVKVQQRTLSMEKNFGVKVKEEDLFSRDPEIHARAHILSPSLPSGGFRE